MKPGADRGDLEEDTARLAEVDGAEVEAIDHGSRVRTAGGDALVPRLVLLRRRCPGHVMDGAGAGNPRLARRSVVRVPGAALCAPDLPFTAARRLEGKRLLEEPLARTGIGVRTDGVESLERELVRDLRVVGDERLVRGLHDGELEPEALGIVEAQPPVLSLDGDVLVREPLGPEVEGLLRGDAEDDAVDHAAACAARTRVWILEERDVAAGAAFLVCVEEVVDGGIVLVHRLLDETQTEHADVEVDVARSVGGDARDVMDPLEAHRLDSTPMVVIQA